jgi:hypothetical protein
MKTKKQVLKEHPDYAVLINAVISRVGMDSVMDIVKHGIDGGFNGFIYYEETHRFAMRHRKLIISLLEEEASSLGEEVVEMICNFGIFRNSKADSDDKKEIYRYLGGGRCDQSTITNVMAWFAAEEVCRWFDE